MFYMICIKQISLADFCSYLINVLFCLIVYLFSLPFPIHANLQDVGKTRNESNRLERMNQTDIEPHPKTMASN